MCQLAHPFFFIVSILFILPVLFLLSLVFLSLFPNDNYILKA